MNYLFPANFNASATSLNVRNTIHLAKSLAYSSFQVQNLNVPHNIQTHKINSKFIHLERKLVVAKYR